MSGYWNAPDDYAEEVRGDHGSAHSVSSGRPEYDAAAEVRRIAEEVTGKVFVVAKRRIGFTE